MSKKAIIQKLNQIKDKLTGRHFDLISDKILEIKLKDDLTQEDLHELNLLVKYYED